MEFLLPISIMVFLNLFLIFRLLYMTINYAQSKDVKLSQFRIYEGHKHKGHNLFSNSQPNSLYFEKVCINLSSRKSNQKKVCLGDGSLIN